MCCCWVQNSVRGAGGQLWGHGCCFQLWQGCSAGSHVGPSLDSKFPWCKIRSGWLLVIHAALSLQRWRSGASLWRGGNFPLWLNTSQGSQPTLGALCSIFRRAVRQQPSISRAQTVLGCESWPRCLVNNILGDRGTKNDRCLHWLLPLKDVWS